MALPCSRSHVTVQTCPEPSGRLQATLRSGAEGDESTIDGHLTDPDRSVASTRQRIAVSSTSVVVAPRQHLGGLVGGPSSQPCHSPRPHRVGNVSEFCGDSSDGQVHLRLPTDSRIISATRIPASPNRKTNSSRRPTSEPSQTPSSDPYAS